MATVQQKTGGGGAGAIVTTAIGVYLGTTSHPYWALLLYACAVLAAIYAALQWSWVQRVLGFHLLEPMPSYSAPVNSNATANGNKVEQHFHNVFTQPLPVPTPSAVSVPEYPTFNWQFRFARVVGTNSVWRETKSSSGLQSLILELSAVPPRTGTRVRKCTVYGCIELASEKHTGVLGRLCWLGEVANEMSFEIGKSAILFVLCFQANADTGYLPKWSTFQNPVDKINDNLSFTGATETDGKYGKQIMLPVSKRSPTFTITLVDPYSSYVVARKSFRLQIAAEEDWNVKEIANEA